MRITTQQRGSQDQDMETGRGMVTHIEVQKILVMTEAGLLVGGVVEVEIEIEMGKVACQGLVPIPCLLENSGNLAAGKHRQVLSQQILGLKILVCSRRMDRCQNH